MTKITGLVLAAALSFATPVSAITLETTTNASGSAGVGTGNGIDINVTSDTSVETNTRAETNAGVSTETNTIRIEADALEDMAITVTSSSAVDSESERDIFAKGVVKANADVRDVILSDDEVAVSYRSHARIFGLIPTKVFARAHVTSDGEVSVKYPWYAFAAQKKAALESRVKASVKPVLPSLTANAEAQAKLSAQAQAAVLEKTVATMKADFEADAAAKAQVN